MNEDLLSGAHLLPCWFVKERLMSDTWTFGLLLTTGQVVCVEHVERITRDAAGELWLEVRLLTQLGEQERPGWNILPTPTDRPEALIAVRHVIMAFDLGYS